MKYEYLQNGEREREKRSITSFKEVDIPHRMEPLRMFYTVTLTYIVKVNNFLNINISETVRAIAKMYDATLIEFDICYQMTPLRMTTEIFKVTNLKRLYLRNDES